MQPHEVRLRVGRVHRQVVEGAEEARALLNRCLTDSPRGSIIATEKSFTILQIGEHQVVLQWICYHVGFPRKPSWLVGE